MSLKIPKSIKYLNSVQSKNLAVVYLPHQLQVILRYLRIFIFSVFDDDRMFQ